MGKTIIIVVLLILILVFALYVNLSNNKIEGFKNSSCCTNLGSDNNSFINPTPNDDILLKDSYPLKEKIGVSNDTANKIWWHYPTFEVGSYAQITNNLKYPNNPDVGRCTATEFCGSIYDEYQKKSNYIKPLPPIDPNCGTRVGYFTTGINLLPFRNDIQNILY
jgi:hypothetical protein